MGLNAISLRRPYVKFVAASLVPVFFIGCLTNDPYTREQKVNKTTKGAVIGGVAGALGGLLTGRNTRSRRKRAIMAAGIGAIAGAAVGRYMDVQEAKLREQLGSTGVSVAREGNELRLIMPGNITFQTNSADIQSDFYDVLNGVAVVLKEYDSTMVEVSGHTDSTGEDAYNQSLSERRAASVRSYLQSQGVQDVRLEAQGLGEKQPIASNDTPQGREQNRRVELRLVPISA